MEAVVCALFVYPVKSCRAIALDRATVETRGLRHDRRWMVVDEAGMFVTQRTEPRLALVDVAIREREGTLVLSTADRPALKLPLVLPRATTRRRVRVWRDDVDAIDCGAEAAAWMTHWLGSRVSIVFMPDDVERAVNPTHTRAGDLVGFADGYPLLLASVPSLEDLNSRLAQPVPMDRFRPNIVVSDCAPWAEDTWTRLRVGAVSLRVAKPCSRCVITTTDQRTAERGLEPLRTLATFRTRGNEVWFAQNCVPDGPGTVAVGDAVLVEAATMLPVGGDAGPC